MAARTIDTGTSELLCKVEDRVATITLNRPEARNSLSDELTPALRRMALEMGKDESVGAILITGAGDAFCSGGNIKDMGSGNSDASPMTPEDRVTQLKHRQRTLTGRIAAIPKPTIAALPGPAAGAGLSIALSCDIRIAAETAFVTTAYANIGLSGDYGMAWFLTRLLGRSRALDLMYSAERVSAQDGLAMGLFNHVVPKDELRTYAFDYAKNLANGPTAAFAAMKDNIDFAAEHDLGSSLDREAKNMVRTAASDDHREAIRKFLQNKRS